MGRNVAVIGSNKPSWSEEPNLTPLIAEKEVRHSKKPDYGFKIRKAMTAAKLSADRCSRETGLGQTTIKTARAGQYIRFHSHQIIIDALETELPRDKKALARIAYPWPNRGSSRGVPQPGALPRTTIKFPDKIMSGKAHMPQAADGWELELDGGRLENLTCSIETRTPYFRFGVKLFPEDGVLCGDTTIQTKFDVLIHVARNHWDQPGVAKKNELFMTHYRWGAKTPKNERVCTVGPLAKAKLQLALDKGFKVTFDVNGRRHLEMQVEPEVCSRVALFAWDDHYGDLKVKVADIVATVVKPA
jgi:hypothetical protein